MTSLHSDFQHIPALAFQSASLIYKHPPATMRTDSAEYVDNSPSSEFSVPSLNDTTSSPQPDPRGTPFSPLGDNDGFEELTAPSDMSFTDAEVTDTDMMSSSSAHRSSARLECMLIGRSSPSFCCSKAAVIKRHKLSQQRL